MSSSNTRKRDRYEARARELALAAGVDPDSRIERPGQRSMPAWCAYRDAARTERVATETAAVAAELPPQGPKYRDAPLKVELKSILHSGTQPGPSGCLGVAAMVATNNGIIYQGAFGSRQLSGRPNYGGVNLLPCWPRIALSSVPVTRCQRSAINVRRFYYC
jgi:hypothetical protein